KKLSLSQALEASKDPQISQLEKLRYRVYQLFYPQIFFVDNSVNEDAKVSEIRSQRVRFRLLEKRIFDTWERYY
ncbi:hypothetical protein, partial [Vibrio cholerae]|uniref:hypothetical protein n=2 Tax=Vibrio cholerae TaxID=666 RepID=UPI00226F5C17